MALYEKIMKRDAEHMSELFPVNRLDVTFEVRSSQDPMLLAKKLSNNSFDFGLSAHDLQAIGFLGLIISVLLMFRPCIVICSIRRIPRYQDLDKLQVRDPELESVIRRRGMYARQSSLDHS